MKPDVPVTVRVTRAINATPERVYAAWLDEAQLGHWMFGPEIRNEQVLHIKVDARVGGAFSFLVKRQGHKIDHVGDYLELEAPRRLAFTWATADSADRSRVAVDIAPRDGGSEITLTHEMHPNWADYAGRVEGAWKTMLDALAKLLETK